MGDSTTHKSSDALDIILDLCNFLGFLNSFFSDWFSGDSESRLPFGYNAQRTLYWMTHKTQPGYWRSISPLKVGVLSSENLVPILTLNRYTSTFFCGVN